MMKKIPSHREGYVDIAKAIGIICVILGHISTIPAELKTYIYAFHMPLFFLCYGLIPRKDISHTAKTALGFVQKRFDGFSCHIFYGRSFTVNLAFIT